MVDPAKYTVAISHLERARTAARLAKATRGSVRAEHEAQEKHWHAAALKEIARE